MLVCCPKHFFNQPPILQVAYLLLLIKSEQVLSRYCARIVMQAIRPARHAQRKGL